MARSIKFHLKKAAVAVAFVALSGTAAAQQAVWDGSLPAAGDPITSQQYQDFTIYSLNYLTNLQAMGYYPGLTSPTYDVKSGIGQLDPYIVLVTGNTGNLAENNTTNPQQPQPCGTGGCDDAYAYPSPKAEYFSTIPLTDPSPVVTGEPTASVWTATASALRTYLDGNDLVFMFNLNEDGGGDPNTLDGQALLVSMKVELTDAAGKVLYTYYIGANNAIGLPTTAAQAWAADGAPIADPSDPNYDPLGTLLLDTKTLDSTSTNGWISTDPRWAYVHGQISVDATTGVFLGMGDCIYTGFTNCKSINQNLGANEVAFSAFNQQLSDLIADASSGVAFMNVTALTSGQSNGFEQLFIMAVNIPTQVPEPGSLALAGLGLLSLGLIRRRRQSSTQA